MSREKKEVQPKTNEENARKFHQDGIIDIITGAVLLNFGFDILNESSTTSLFTFIPIILLTSMKRQITIQRIGYDAFYGGESTVKRWMFAIAAGLVVMVAVLGILVLDGPTKLVFQSSWMHQNNIHSLVAGLVIAASSAIAAFLLPLRRLYLYSAFSLLAGLIGFFLLPAYIPVFAVSILMLGIGARLLVKFMRAFPVEPPKKSK